MEEDRGKKAQRLLKKAQEICENMHEGNHCAAWTCEECIWGRALARYTEETLIYSVEGVE